MLSLDLCPSSNIRHVKLMSILMTGEFKKLFLYFYFLNRDILLIIQDTNLKP